MTFWLVIAGAAVGAPARYGVSRALNHLRGFPWGTLTANTVGAAVLGFVLGHSEGRDPSSVETLLIAFCGAFTTYSAFALETAELGFGFEAEGGRWEGLFYAATTVAAGLVAAAAGWVLS